MNSLVPNVCMVVSPAALSLMTAGALAKDFDLGMQGMELMTTLQGLG